MFVIGLTGGIGTGKTEVSKVLRELGAHLIEADDVAHETYRRDTPGWRRVLEEFGEGVLTSDGEVDRKKLGAVVFRDKRALERLNAIVHPRTRSLIGQRLERLRESGAEVVVVEVPLLVEAMREDADWVVLLDEVWVTDAAEDLVVERVRRRSRLGATAIMARIRSQASREERLAHASVVIDNSSTLDELSSRVRELWENRVSHWKRPA